MSGPIRAADIVAGTFLLLKRGAGRCAVAFGILCLARAGMDAPGLGSDVTVGLDFMLILAGAAVQSWLVRGALGELGAPQSGPVRLGAFILLSLAYTLATILGLFLLIVPGLCVAVRWWVAAPMLFDCRLSPREALAASWRATAGHERPLLLLVAAFYLPSIVAFSFTVAAAHPEEPGAAALLLADLLGLAGMILGALSSVAAYAAISGRRPDVAEIFA